jgi:hypothetical protein
LSGEPVFEALERRKLLVEFSAGEHWPDLRHLVRKYANLPMSLADAWCAWPNLSPTARFSPLTGISAFIAGTAASSFRCWHPSERRILAQAVNGIVNVERA